MQERDVIITCQGCNTRSKSTRILSAAHYNPLISLPPPPYCLRSMTAPPPPTPTLVLLGDSTLDNILWVPSPSSCLASQLRAAGFSVFNYAADGFTTDDVLNGGKPLLSRAARERAGDALPGWGAERDAAAEGVFEPLKHVEELAGKAGTMGVTAVLSVGGNDIRHILADMKGVHAAVARLHRNYEALLDRLLRLRPVVNTVICMQYRPCISEGASSPPLPPPAFCSQIPRPPLPSPLPRRRNGPKILRSVRRHGDAAWARECGGEAE
jgi:hypothetical protein